MTKRLVAKIGTYEKDGATKGEYAKIGVILERNGGEFILLDPCVNLAGVLAKQRKLEPDRNSDMVLVNIFADDDNKPQTNTASRENAIEAPDDIPF